MMGSCYGVLYGGGNQGGKLRDANFRLDEKTGTEVFESDFRGWGYLLIWYSQQVRLVELVSERAVAFASRSKHTILGV